MRFQKTFLFCDGISFQHAWNASVAMACLLVIQIEIQAVWCLINFFLQPRFAYKVGDGVCDQVLNTAECCYDGNDCKSFASECSQCPRNFVRILRLHKGKCLPSFNTPQCCYSLGACSNINECQYSAKLPLVQKYIQVCASNIQQLISEYLFAVRSLLEMQFLLLER